MQVSLGGQVGPAAAACCCRTQVPDDRDEEDRKDEAICPTGAPAGMSAAQCAPRAQQRCGFIGWLPGQLSAAVRHLQPPGGWGMLPAPCPAVRSTRPRPACPDMNVICDDDLREIFAPLAPGAKLTVCADCCHSGSLLDHAQVGPGPLGGARLP